MSTISALWPIVIQWILTENIAQYQQMKKTTEISDGIKIVKFIVAGTRNCQ